MAQKNRRHHIDNAFIPEPYRRTVTAVSFTLAKPDGTSPLSPVDWIVEGRIIV